MSHKIETYVVACLSNPEFIKQVAARYGRDGSVGMPEIATAIFNLENALRAKLTQTEERLDDDS